MEKKKHKKKPNIFMTTGTMCTHKTKIKGNRVSSMHDTLKYILFQYMHVLYV